MPAHFVIVIGLIIAIVVFVARRQRQAFKITIRDGQPHVDAGSPDPDFVTDVERICNLWGVRQGAIRGVKTRKGLRIRCTGPLKKQWRAFQNAINYPL